jgi:hypothetical protein
MSMAAVSGDAWDLCLCVVIRVGYIVTVDWWVDVRCAVVCFVCWLCFIIIFMTSIFWWGYKRSWVSFHIFFTWNVPWFFTSRTTCSYNLSSKIVVFISKSNSVLVKIKNILKGSHERKTKNKGSIMSWISCSTWLNKQMTLLLSINLFSSRKINLWNPIFNAPHTNSKIIEQEMTARFFSNQLISPLHTKLIRILHIDL